MINSPKNVLRKDVALRKLLETNRSVYVWLDSRKNVAVPDELRGLPQLILQLGYDMPVAIPDIEIDNDGWSATLTFSQRPFTCVIPWEAVYVVVGESSGKGAVWPENVPPEVDLGGSAVNAGQNTRTHDSATIAVAGTAPPQEKKKKLPAGWKVIEGGG